MPGEQEAQNPVSTPLCLSRRLHSLIRLNFYIGKILMLDHDIDGDGRIDFHDLQWEYLEGDGDFRSAESSKNA